MTGHRASTTGRLKRDIWRMADGRWGAETMRNGVEVGIRHVSLARAVWHLLTVRRPDDYGALDLGPRRPPPRPGGNIEAGQR